MAFVRTIWNARCAAADLLAPTRHRIVSELAKTKFLGIDETHYPINGENGYVGMVRINDGAPLLPIATRGEAGIVEHMSERLHIPVITDEHIPYPHISRRCSDAGRTYSATPEGRTWENIHNPPIQR